MTPNGVDAFETDGDVVEGSAGNGGPGGRYAERLFGMGLSIVGRGSEFSMTVSLLLGVFWFSVKWREAVLR